MLDLMSMLRCMSKLNPIHELTKGNWESRGPLALELSWPLMKKLGHSERRHQAIGSIWWKECGCMRKPLVTLQARYQRIEEMMGRRGKTLDTKGYEQGNL